MMMRMIHFFIFSRMGMIMSKLGRLPGSSFIQILTIKKGEVFPHSLSGQLIRPFSISGKWPDTRTEIRPNMRQALQ